MSASGGGDIGELLRSLGADALVHEGHSAGLAPVGMRMRCPWAGCEHKGKERERDAQVFAGKGGHHRIFCFACSGSGDFLDLLERTRGLSRAEAIAHVQGQPVSARPRPELRVVSAHPAEHPDKMATAEVARLWNSLALDDEAGRAYLSKRNLEGAVDDGLVRFVPRDTTNKLLTGRLRQGYLIAALTSDVVGNPRGIQLRLARPGANSSEVTIVSVKGSVTSTAFFGEPGLIEGAPVIAVAEGFADTTALRLWAEGRAVVVGGAGKGTLHHIAGELEAAGISIEGKLFALFPQNDEPKNPSRQEFKRLQQLLVGRGARVCWVQTPREHADLADWLKAAPDTAWPPAELALAFGNEPGDEREPVTVLPDGQALPMLRKYTSDKYAQNLTTLASLLDDPSSRESLFLSREELSLCQMTTRLRVGGREVVAEDFTKLRLNIEQIARSTDGKPLQFTESDIEKVITMLASRNQVHEVQRWLKALPAWDGQERLEDGLPRLLGREAGSLQARLIRRWMVAAVARAMAPGCKVDTILILTGKGGGKKSTFFDVLGGEWFTESDIVPGDKDSMLKMRQSWIIEWGELDSMKRSRSTEATKKFLSTRVDLFRAPYGTDTRKAPRHCIFGGTTNETEILGDSTGNRRYWPVEVLVPKIDVKWLRDNRGQLFAEALALYQGGVGCPDCLVDDDGRCTAHRWWLTNEEEALLEEHNKGFEVCDAWQPAIVRWLSEQLVAQVTTEQVLAHALRVPIEDHSNAMQQRVGNVLRFLGWKYGKGRVHGEVENVYRKPEVAQ